MRAGPVISQTNSTYQPLHTYTGREWDEDTGLFYYRYRFYEAPTGRFISEDPMGFAAGDTNIQRYVGNGVTNATDPSGLRDWLLLWPKPKPTIDYLNNNWTPKDYISKFHPTGMTEEDIKPGCMAMASFYANWQGPGNFPHRIPLTLGFEKDKGDLVVNAYYEALRKGKPSIVVAVQTSEPLFPSPGDAPALPSGQIDPLRIDVSGAKNFATLLYVTPPHGRGKPGLTWAFMNHGWNLGHYEDVRVYHSEELIWREEMPNTFFLVVPIQPK